MLTFSEQEFKKRYERAYELMKRGNIDALMVTEKSNYCYFTPHRSIGWVTKTRPIILILPYESDPVLIVHEWEIGNAKANCPWIKDIRTWIDLPFSISPVLEVFQDLKLTTGRIGVELGNEQRLNLSPMDFLKLKNLGHSLRRFIVTLAFFQRSSEKIDFGKIALSHSGFGH